MGTLLSPRISAAILGINRLGRGIVACDFFTVETVWLQTLYALFFLRVSTRQIVAVGVTARPDLSWVTQQARNATMDLNDRRLSIRFLLRDHDGKFTRAFDEVFRTEGAAVVRAPIRAPRSNAYAEHINPRPREVRRRDVLGGLLHEYHEVAA